KATKASGITASVHTHLITLCIPKYIYKFDIGAEDQRDELLAPIYMPSRPRYALRSPHDALSLRNYKKEHSDVLGDRIAELHLSPKLLGNQ
uniref:Uncharacterized protein n=1 Tax=Romanomermis culicivorax TaxID=13658 RepID=A0A915K6R8_ROMCU